MRCRCRAIFEAAAKIAQEGGSVVPEIMIPLVGTRRELEETKAVCVKVAEEVMEETGVKIEYQVGTMIEVPRAALVADEIAEEAEFFSFGTNDLTQLTFGVQPGRCRHVPGRLSRPGHP